MLINYLTEIIMKPKDGHRKGTIYLMIGLTYVAILAGVTSILSYSILASLYMVLAYRS